MFLTMAVEYSLFFCRSSKFNSNNRKLLSSLYILAQRLRKIHVLIQINTHVFWEQRHAVIGYDLVRTKRTTGWLSAGERVKHETARYLEPTLVPRFAISYRVCIAVRIAVQLDGIKCCLSRYGRPGRRREYVIFGIILRDMRV